MSNNPNLLLLIGLLLAQWPGMAAVAADATAQDDMELVRSRYPSAFAAIAADCAAPDTLTVTTYQNQDGQPYASLYCWQPTPSSGSRSGQWLGLLPLQEGVTPFAIPFSCPASDDRCATLWPELLATYPSAIAQAEFSCAIRDGILFLNIQPEQVDLRCGFFATTVWDENGDGQVDYEDPVSVDMSATLLPLP